KLKLLRLNLYVNVAWGCLLTAVLVRSLVSGQPCPPTCVANVRPLFDDTCQCAYVNINCKLVNITDPISFLNTSAIGTHLLYLEIRRCDLPTGLPPAALAPFPSLEKIIVLYSHMETWDGPLPPSVMSLMIRFSHLRTIPRALHVNVPPQLVALVLEACFIPSIPDSVIRAWSTVERLYLLNISLQALPSSLATTLPLVDVDFRQNNLTTLPRAWLASQTQPSIFRDLVAAKFAGNPLGDDAMPWGLVTSHVTTDLSGTLAWTMPSNVVVPWNGWGKKTVVLDGTPYCLGNQSSSTPALCAPICAPGCFGYMRGDYLCNLECFNIACGFDGGDCDDFGFDSR
ncbi:hypothetical protein As57867_004153, partial [Aphanomyces stellatus]